MQLVTTIPKLLFDTLCPLFSIILWNSGTRTLNSPTEWPTQKTQPLLLRRCVYRALRGNGQGAAHIEHRSSIVARVCCGRYLAAATVYQVTA
jgi:hypothetical protein